MRILINMIDSLGVKRTRSPDDSVHLVPLLQKELRQIRAILPRYSRNQCCRHVSNSRLILPRDFTTQAAIDIVFFIPCNENAAGTNRNNRNHLFSSHSRLMTSRTLSDLASAVSWSFCVYARYSSATSRSCPLSSRLNLT